MKLGLALGSGGARGWCHIGVLQELKAQGIEADMVAGSSMGALVGAAWAAGCLDALEDWACALTRAKFLGYLDLRLSAGGWLGGAAVSEVLAELGLPETFSDLAKPCLAVATDMSSGREVWLSEGPLAPAIRASISIPGVFSPQELDGRWLLDGGLVNPVPNSAARALGADVILAVNPNGRDGPLWQAEPSQPLWQRLGAGAMRDTLPEPVARLLPEETEARAGPAYVDVVSTSIDILTEYLRKTREAADPPHLTLNARLGDISVMEIYRAEEAIEEGRRIVRDAADRLDTLLGR